MMSTYNLAFADERPVETLPAVRYWSENYAFVGYDYKSRAGFGAYVGRWVKNPKLWREQLYLFLPDGTTLSHISIGEADDIRVPTAGSLRFRCDEPGGRWRLNFDGAMRHDTLQSLMHQPVLEAVPHPVRFEVVIDHILPVWMLPASDNATFGKLHYEQMGSCVGSIDFAGQHHSLSGPTYRDHSRGPRHIGGFDGHLWLQLHFTDGPALAAYHAWGQTEKGIVQILDKTVSMRKDGFGKAKLHNHIRLPSIHALPDPVELQVTVEDRSYHLRGKPLGTTMVSISDEVDYFYGYAPMLAGLCAADQHFIFESDHGPVTGFLQRSWRMPSAGPTRP